MGRLSKSTKTDGSPDRPRFEFSLLQFYIPMLLLAASKLILVSGITTWSKLLSLLSMPMQYLDCLLLLSQNWISCVGVTTSIALSQQLAPCSSSSSVLNEWWKACWKFRLPPKIKMFLWRIFHGWILVYESLFNKKVRSSPICPLCLQGNETVIHAIWGCCELRPARGDSGATRNIPFKGLQTPADFLLLCFSSLLQEEFELLAVILWRS
ncbi:hypothetical protein ACOSQ3_017099 [Xanthoceras sorbifolium]